MTGHAWHDPNYEGKLLRKVITRLQKRFMKEDSKEDADLEKLTRLAHIITLTAKTKQDIAKYEYQEKKIKKLMDYVDSKQLKKYVDIEGDLPALT